MYGYREYHSYAMSRYEWTQGYTEHMHSMKGMDIGEERTIYIGNGKCYVMLFIKGKCELFEGIWGNSIASAAVLNYFEAGATHTTS